MKRLLFLILWIAFSCAAASGQLISGPGGAASVASTTKSVAQAAHGFSVGDVLRMDGANYVKARSDNDTNAETVGIVSVVTDANNFVLATGGYVSGLSGLSAGSMHFLDPITAGALTTTEPTTIGQISKPVFIATSTTAGYFFNMRGAEIGGSSAALTPSVLASVSVNLNEGMGTAQLLYTVPIGFNLIITEVALRNFSGTVAAGDFQIATTAGPITRTIQFSDNLATTTSYILFSAAIGDGAVQGGLANVQSIGLSGDTINAFNVNGEGHVRTAICDLIGYLIPQ